MRWREGRLEAVGLEEGGLSRGHTGRRIGSGTREGDAACGGHRRTLEASLPPLQLPVAAVPCLLTESR